MKELLTVVSLLVGAVVGDAPYAPSGWRPDGPTLELPQRIPQNQQYLPPVDPRNSNNVPDQYGPPETEVSVQGLPTDEQLPIFQVSPVNGQQYLGSYLQADVKNLERDQQQLLYQQQQQIYRQFARQRQLEAAKANRLSTPQTPAQFVPRTTPSTAPTSKPESRTTPVEATTEALDLNEGEVLDDKKNDDKVTVEVSKQNIQEFPPELYLSPLAQLNLQSQYAPLQLGQIQAPVYFQPAQGLSQKQIAAYDAATHFAALPSVLAQQRLAQQQLVQQQLVQQQLVQQQIVQQQQQLAQQQLAQQQLAQQQLAQQQSVQAQVQPQSDVQNIQPQVVQTQPAQSPAYFVPRASAPELIPGQQAYQPVNYQPSYDQAQLQPQYPQIQATPVVFQPQYNQQGLQRPDEEQGQQQPQFVYQGYQPQLYQTGQEQPLVSGYYPQMVTSQFGNQPQQQVFQGQEGSLQSGLDANQQGNGIDQTEDKEDGDDNGSTATAVATAFGSRTRPRVYNAYGVPVPRVQSNPEYQTTTEINAQGEAEGPAIAEATAVARGDRRKTAKLRNRRVRPVFTLDKSGHLVLSQDQ